MKNHMWVVELDGKPRSDISGLLDAHAIKGQAEAKKKFLKELFKHPKYRVVKYIPASEKKGK